MNQFKTMTRSDVKAGIKFFHKEEHFTMEWSFRKQFGKDLVLYKRHSHQVALVTGVTDTGFDISVWLFNQEATVHIPFDQVYIIDPVIKITSTIEKPTIEDKIKQMGYNFTAWADNFFTRAVGGLDCYVPRYYLYQDYLNNCGNPKVSIKQFEEKLNDYADIQGYTFNPVAARNTKGRVVIRTHELKYDYNTQQWGKTEGIKNQGMIYMKTPNVSLQTRVFDPTLIK